MDASIANRLHRSGAIDFNVEFATRQAQINLSSSNKDGKRLWANTALGPGNDGLSVCEGEPLYTTKRSKGNHYSSIDSSRNPVSCMSSLNGYVPPEGTTKIHQYCQQIAKLRASGKSEDIATQILYYHRIREIFFSGLTFVGISVTKWAFER